MAIKHMSQVICDKCGVMTEPLEGREGKARRLAGLRGWTDNITTGTLKTYEYRGDRHSYYPVERGDYCPQCHAEGIAAYRAAKAQELVSA